MTDINHVTEVGRLTKDAEMKNNGIPIAYFTIAVNRRRKDGNGLYVEEASFFDVNVYGKYAEAIIGRLKKGVQVGIDGSLKQERWNNESGNHSRVVINADLIEIMGRQE